MAPEEFEATHDYIPDFLKALGELAELNKKDVNFRATNFFRRAIIALEGQIITGVEDIKLFNLVDLKGVGKGTLEMFKEFIETGKIKKLEEMRPEEEKPEDTELIALIEVYTKQDEIKAKVKWDAFVEAHRPLRFDFLKKPFTLCFATEHCLPNRTNPHGCVVRINAGYYQREVKFELEKIICTSNYDVNTLKAKVREYKWTFPEQEDEIPLGDTSEAWPYEHNDKIVQTDLERYEGTVDDAHHFLFRVCRDGCEPRNAGEWGLKSSGWTPPGLGDYLAETLGKKRHYWQLEAKRGNE